MKVAITGGTGFVGRALARRLEAEGHEVVRCSRRTGGDVRDLDALRTAFAGCDAVAHCAGINRELRGQTYEEVHVRGTHNVVRAAREAGAAKLVLMSFLRARPDCGEPYHESKWAAEELVRASGLDVTVIKAGVVYGRGDHMLDHLSRSLHTMPVFASVGLRPQPMRPTAVLDLARVLVAALTDPRLANRTVPVTGPTELTLSEAVGIVGEAIGRRPLRTRLPVLAHRALAHVLERTMKVPLVALAQVRILSESLVEPAGPVDALPADLAPRTPFDLEAVRARLPEPGPFRASDFGLSACPH